MKNYAYIDKQGILRVVSGEETARQYTANGKVVETTVPCKNGTPTLYNKALKATEEVWVFGIGKAYWEPREKAGEEIKLKDYPELMGLFNLYGRLM